MFRAVKRNLDLILFVGILFICLSGGAYVVHSFNQIDYYKASCNYLKDRGQIPNNFNCTKRGR